MLWLFGSVDANKRSGLQVTQTVREDVTPSMSLEQSKSFGQGFL